MVFEQRITACAAAEVHGFDLLAEPGSPTDNCMSPACLSAPPYGVADSMFKAAIRRRANHSSSVSSCGKDRSDATAAMQSSTMGRVLRGNDRKMPSRLSMLRCSRASAASEIRPLEGLQDPPYQKNTRHCGP